MSKDTSKRDRVLPPAGQGEGTARGPTRPVLVVDEDLAFRREASRALSDAGVPVVLASDGVNALRYLTAAPTKPGLIVLDLVLPGMDGQRFASILREDPALRSIPILLLGGASFVNVTGAVERLVKPISPDALVDAVHRHALL